MARRYYTLRYFKNFDCFFICLLVGNLCLCNIMHEFYFLIYLYVRNFDYLCRPKRKCGEIWLLATTLKNAKMLTIMVIEAMMTAFISMFCVFVTAPHLCGAFVFMPRCPLSPAVDIPPERCFSWRNGIKTKVCPSKPSLLWTNGIKTKTYPPKPVFSWTKVFRPRDLSLTDIELKEKFEEYELLIYI